MHPDLPNEQAYFDRALALRDRQQADLARAPSLSANPRAAVELRKLHQRGGLDHVGQGLYRFEDIPTTPKDEFMEAVLRVGEDAVLAGDAVLALHDLGLAHPRRIHVATPRRVRRQLPPFIKVEQRAVPRAERTTYEGIPAMTVAGAIRDCRGLLMPERLIDAVTEAAQADVAQYATFNAFFSRALKPGLRPIARADFVCPVDGAISQFGGIDDHEILQAKGHRFTTQDLLGGDGELAEQFRHGSFANLYLSPRDYHRLHMPCDGVLERMIYVPGSLFSVNPVTARGVPNLFARNERVICLFASPEHGPFACVLVGATIVGSIATT